MLIRYYMAAKEITKAFDDGSLAKNDPWTNKPIPANILTGLIAEITRLVITGGRPRVTPICHFGHGFGHTKAS